MGYLRRRRFDYTEKELEVFRKRVREVVVPAAASCTSRRKLLGSIHSIIMTNPSLLRQIRFRSEIEYLVGEAQMYRELSRRAESSLIS
ncbi:MAG: hypothetical protein ACLTFJ_12860 [Clostridium sp.]